MTDKTMPAMCLCGKTPGSCEACVKMFQAQMAWNATVFAAALKEMPRG